MPSGRFEQDREGNLWIGTRGGGLNRFKDGIFSVYTTKDGLVSDGVQGLFIDRAAALWIATRQGLTRFKDGRFATVTVTEGLYSSFVYSFVEDDLGTSGRVAAKASSASASRSSTMSPPVHARR